MNTNILPTVWAQIYCQLYGHKYTANCMGTNILPTVWTLIYCQLYGHKYTANCMDSNILLPSYQPFDESQVNENVFCWKSGSLIRIDGTKLVLMDIGAHLCVSFGSSIYWTVSKIRSLPELTGWMWSDVVGCNMCPKRQ